MFKRVITGAIAGVVLGTTPFVWGQDMPKAPEGVPIRFFVPGPAGSPIDVLIRSITNKMQSTFGRPFVVENRPGTAGNRAAEAVATAAPDGLTYLVGVNTITSVNPWLYSKMRFDPNKDLVPVATIVEGGYMLVANNKQPYNTVQELIEYGRKNPDAVSYASYGSGSMPHICMEQLQSITGAKFRHVPYRENYTNDLIGGHVDMGFGMLSHSIPNAQNGNLKGLAFTYKRLPLMPNVPAMSETIPGYQCLTFTGIWGPKGLPEPMLKRMNEEISKVVRTPEFATTATAIGGTAVAKTPAEFAEMIRVDNENWKKVIPPLNLKVD